MTHNLNIDMNYCFVNNIIHVIYRTSPKLNKVWLYECKLSHRIKCNTHEKIYFSNEIHQDPLIFSILNKKEFKKALFFEKLTKYVIFENNTYNLGDIINCLASEKGHCDICFEDDVLLTQNLYKCSHSNFCTECSIKWNTHSFNNCPICRAGNAIEKRFIKALKHYKEH